MAMMERSERLDRDDDGEEETAWAFVIADDSNDDNDDVSGDDIQAWSSTRLSSSSH